MKRIKLLLPLFLLLNIFTNLFAQNFPDIKPPLDPSPASNVDCEKATSLNCNYIKNDQFESITGNSLNPFPFSLVPDWVETHGSPALNDFLNPPTIPPSNIRAYASMYSWSLDGQRVEGEGIAQKISPLDKDKSYSLSFFKKLAAGKVGDKSYMDKFYIVLLHCDDYRTIHNYPSYDIPNIPGRSQIIYCETRLKNIEWEQVVACFNADDNYDLVWIFPKQDLTVVDPESICGVDFTGLELIDSKAFTAGPRPAPTTASPVVTIGPERPNCTLRNAELKWHGPNGQIIDAGPNQTIDVNASDSLQRGTWTLVMDVPRAVSPDNKCSDKCEILSSVEVFLQKDITTIVCHRGLPATCNLIENSSFSTICYGDDPFFNNCVIKWDYAFGSPQLNTYFNALDANNNTASMWSSSVLGVYENAVGEGIITGIPNLIVGHRYNFSFYKAAVENHPSSTISLDELNIILINCNDYTEMLSSTNPGIVPPIPTGAQLIYCEKNVANSNLHRVTVCFTASSNYDLLWISPRQWTWAAQQWWLGFAKPELIDVTNFTAGSSPVLNPNNCNVTIGPSTPNCAPSGAVFTWIPPNNGNPIIASASQQLTINANLPQNAGVWTLRMTVPGSVTTNNTCSNTCNTIQATVTVPRCYPPGPPIITTASYFQYGGCGPSTPPNRPIIPNGNNQYCFFWECGGTSHFFSSIQNNNQWYVNDILISTSGASPATGSVNIDNPGELKISLSSGSTQYFKVQLKNTTYGYQQLTNPTFVYHATYTSNDLIGYYKPNYTGTYTTPFGLLSGPNSTYTWSIPGVTIYDATNTNPQVQITFPPNSPTPTINGTLTISNSYCNGTYPVYFSYDPNLRLSTNSINNDTVVVFPNPADTYIKIQSTEQIKSIQLRNIHNNSTIVSPKLIDSKIEVGNLEDGIYNLKIALNDKTINKLIIIRH